MTDNVDLTGALARGVINMNVPEDVSYWTRKLGVTREQLQKAVDYVGGKEARVVDYLRSKGMIRF